MKPNYGELIFIILVGALQPLVEILWDTQMATYYNGIAVVLVLAYVTIQIVRSGGSVLRMWGLRFDNFLQCLLPYLLFAAVATVVLYGYGWFARNTPLSMGFWYVLAMYPIWGIAQQFVLQNFVAKNLVTAVPSLPLRSLVVALLFASAHFPSLELVVLAFAVGFIFTYLYHLYPNLVALGLAHGILGALVFHLVLGQDQWEILVRYFS